MWTLKAHCLSSDNIGHTQIPNEMIEQKKLGKQEPSDTDFEIYWILRYWESWIICNNRLSPKAIEAKNNKYRPLLADIASRGWKIEPLIVITAGARVTAHIPSMKALETNFKIPMVTIKNTFKNINTIAIQYAMSILLHKRRIENHQPLPHNPYPP
jgi:hypothetical protein